MRKFHNKLASTKFNFALNINDKRETGNRRGPALRVKCAELHITFRRINANLINFFKVELVKFMSGHVSSNMNKIHRSRMKQSIV